MTTRDSAPGTPTTAIFTGHARLPQSLGHRFGSTMVSVEAEVELDSGRITDASCFPVSDLAERLVKSVLIGRGIATDIDDAAAEIQQRYVGPAQRAIVTAIINVRETYLRWRQTGQQPSPDI